MEWIKRNAVKCGRPGEREINFREINTLRGTLQAKSLILKDRILELLMQLVYIQDFANKYLLINTFIWELLRNVLILVDRGGRWGWGEAILGNRDFNKKSRILSGSSWDAHINSFIFKISYL